jgi:hypothetical protein
LTEVKRTRGLVDFSAELGVWTIPLAALAAVPPCKLILPLRDGSDWRGDEPIDIDDPVRRATKWGYTDEEILLVMPGLKRPPAEAHDDQEPV